MDIFYIDVEEFTKTHDKIFLENFSDGKSFKTEKRFLEYTIGRYLVKKVLKDFFAIDDDIVLDLNKKPILKKSEIYFSISHSNKYVMACFYKKPCGLDLEFIKSRDFSRFAKYYKKTFESAEDFYKFWTQKEASYKLHEPFSSIYSSKFKDNYYLTVVSSDSIDKVSINSI